MSTLETLGSAKARRAANAAMVQQGPNPAGNAAIVDMEVDNDGEEDTIVDEDDDGLIDEELID